MTSSGLKRPLNFGDMANPHLGGSSVASLNQQQQQHCNINSKRRCTTFGSRSQQHTPAPQSAFQDPAHVVGPLADEVASMIRQELSKAASGADTWPVKTNPNTSNNYNPASPNDTSNTEPPTPEIPQLTVSQTQLICERLIRHREEKLREEYDKTLINKLAEQYDTFVKYTHDYIEARSRMHSHQASYLS